MQLDSHDRSTSSPARTHALRCAHRVLVLLAATALAQASGAAEMELVGTGTFKPVPAERLATVPADLPFSAADLASGTWSFAIRYEDQTRDADFDPFAGRFLGAVRSFRLRVGSSTVDLPVERAEIIVSDGGLGYPERESIEIQATSKTPYGVMRVSWVQIHQTPTRSDLRGAPGALAGDAVPAPALLAKLSTARPFDRFLVVRVDSPGQAQSLFYLSSSTWSVSGKPFAAP